MKNALIIVVVLLQACSMGPKYQPAPLPDNEKALIYLLRGDVEYGGGYSTPFYVKDVEVVSLFDDGYSWIHLNSGKYKFRAGRYQLELDIKPGVTYYLEYHQETRFVIGYRDTKGVFKAYSKEQILGQLSGSRYKEANSLESGKRAMDREYIEFDSPKNAKIKFVLNDNSEEGNPLLQAGLHDNYETCVSGYQGFTKGQLTKNSIQIPSGEYLSFTVNSGIYDS